MPRVKIAGGGLIGLTIALELNRRGWQVTVVERGHAMRHASSAAAGMLAAEDPHNPAALRDLATWSAELWPVFLRGLNQQAGTAITFQTERTLQQMADGSEYDIAEKSVDPREIAEAVLQAVQRTDITLLEHTSISAHSGDESEFLVHASGAWLSPQPGVRPVKGQMLRVRMPEPLRVVRRSEHVYIVPRLHGPQQGTAIIGATLEEAGFDTTVSDSALATLREMAAHLEPPFADENIALQVEAWAGLRPATADGLPMLGFLQGEREYVASGHFRNGILLAPATAQIVADALEGKREHISLRVFSPTRFA